MDIQDNYLEKKDLERIKYEILDNDWFPWYYSSIKVDSEEHSKYNYQFYHSMYYDNLPKSDFLEILTPLLKKLDILALIKIKVNLTPVTPEIYEYGLHVDLNEAKEGEQYKTAVYYLNTNNGYTLFEDGSKVESVENRMVIFDGNTKHTGTSCTDEKYRAVININYI